MKVGDLIRDKEYPEDIGLIVEVRQESTRRAYTYKVLNLNGKMIWFSRYYIEKGCVRIS